jgi:hypothetical protein
MNILLSAISILAAQSVMAAEPPPFAPTSFCLEQLGSTVVPVSLADTGLGLRLDLPIGPVRIDYGLPLQNDSQSESKFNFNFDGPGPGYRQQRADPSAKNRAA